jgi:5-methylcytosine-specific restriction endonuclease McrA
VLLFQLLRRLHKMSLLSCKWRQEFIMATTADLAAFDRGTDPIIDFFSVEQARALAAYRGDDSLRARIEELASKNTDGELTDSERAEYEGYIQANKFIAILQAKARKRLENGWRRPRAPVHQAQSSRMNAVTRNLVHRRAGFRCEYCGLQQDQSPLAALHVEHVLPRKHGGNDDIDNLALACVDCNLHKGSNVAGYDPETGDLTELFHPRRQSWPDHFERQGVLIIGKTAVGRTTAAVLHLNSEERLQLRIASGQ